MLQRRSTINSSTPLLEAEGLTKNFRVGGLFSRRLLHAVDDVSLAIYPREIVAVVGESGSGKSTVARLLAMVYRPTRGQIRYKGQPLRALRSRQEMLSYRGRVQMVFQDPYSALNPVYPAAHGGLWRLPWEPRSVLPLAAVEGFVRR